MFCEGNTVMQCDGQGLSSMAVMDCDETEMCAGAGECYNLCQVAELTQSNIGCTFFAVSTLNEALDEVVFANDFAVVIGNAPGNPPAEVSVLRGGFEVATDTVQPGESKAISLPFEQALSRAEQSLILANGAYEVVTSVPVAAYQFNPLNFDIGGTSSFTNDASLLLPAHVLTGNYIVGSMPAMAGVPPIGTNDAWFPGYVTIVALEDNTDVTFVSSTNTSGGDISAMTPGGSQIFSLNKGDVAQILSRQPGAVGPLSCETGDRVLVSHPGTGAQACFDNGSDLTGSMISTVNKPLAVFSGHSCMFIPPNKRYCDHLEEQNFPVETWGTTTIMTAPTDPNSAGTVETTYRVVALDDNTEIQFNPQTVSANLNLNQAGWAEFTTAEDFVAGSIGEKKFIIYQYMHGATQPDETPQGARAGDPAMGTSIPVQQLRTNYAFLTPSTYTSNWVNVVAPTDSTILLDDVAVMGWTAIATSSWSVARVQLDPGTHNIRSEDQVKFAITTYGYATDTSYLFVGGMNLLKD